MVEEVGGNGNGSNRGAAEGIELVWAALGTTPLEEWSAPQAAADADSEPDAAPVAASGAEADEEPVAQAAADDPDDDPDAVTDDAEPGPALEDEWAGLRELLAGDGPEPAPAAELDDDDDSHRRDEPPVEIGDAVVIVAEPDTDDADDTVPAADAAVAEAVAELMERVEDLTVALATERAEREQLAGQIDRLATELDVVLGEALADERGRREQLEETLRQVQATLVPERRAGADRRLAERRRERPLRAARAARPEPEPDTVDADADADADVEVEVDEQPAVEAGSEATPEAPFDGRKPSAWGSRLHEVAGSVSPWTIDDIDRLRED